MVEPITMAILASAAAAAANAGSTAYAAHRRKSTDKKEAKRRALAAKEETFADLLESAGRREVETHGSRLAHNAKNSRRRSEAMMETAANLRKAFEV